MKNGRKETKNEIKEEFFELRPYTHIELAKLYNACWLTFQRWVKKNEQEIGKKYGHFYHIGQVLKIFRTTGYLSGLKLQCLRLKKCSGNDG